MWIMTVYLHVKSYVCSSTYVSLSDHVRQWLWHYDYSVRVKSWLFLLGFVSLCGVNSWCYDDIYDDLKMLGGF